MITEEMKLHLGQMQYIERVLKEAEPAKHNPFERAAFIKIVDDLINEHALTKFTQFIQSADNDKFYEDVVGMKDKLYRVSEGVAASIHLFREKSWDKHMEKFMKKEMDSKSAIYTIDIPITSLIRDRVKSGELFAISFMSEGRKGSDMIRLTKLNDIQPYVVRQRTKKPTQLLYAPKYLLNKNVWDKAMMVIAKLTYGEGPNVLLEYQVPYGIEDGAAKVIQNAFMDTIIPKMKLHENVLCLGSKLMDLTNHKIPSHIGTSTRPKNIIPSTIPTIQTVMKEDVMLTMPHHSFDHVLNFIRDCVYDQNVTDIYQTLYRVSSPETSPVLEYLCYAASVGKNVNVIVEGRASEEVRKNKEVAARLESAGVTVFYKAPKDPTPKVHAKFFIAKMNTDQLITYVSTGNFNESTAKSYLDYGYFTYKQDVGHHLIDMFNHMIEDHVYEDGLSHVHLDDTLLWRMNSIKARILEEIDSISARRGGEIILKTNELSDPDIISALEDAATNGVIITIYCRGTCLLPVTKNVTVSSIVGKYLEHSRFYIFKLPNFSQSTYFISTADLSRKKLTHRYEFLMDVSKHWNAVFSIETMSRMLKADTVNKWVVGKNGKYVKLKNSSGMKFNSHKNVNIL